MRDNKYLKNIKSCYVFILFFFYMIICFLIPTFINGDIREFFSLQQIKEEKTIESFSGDSISLLLTETNEVINISLADYLKGVLVGEMPISFEVEALKAQAIVARTYTINKIKNSENIHQNGATICDNINCCQAYKSKKYALECWEDNVEIEKWNKIENAVNETSGEVIVYNGELINAFFHAHSGGKTENVKYLWSKTEIPYLVSVSGNEADMNQNSVSIKKSEFKEIIKSLVPDYNENSKINIKNYTGSGRVNKVSIDGVELDATKLRELTKIKSTNFRLEDSGDTIVFYTVGYGHGVGMSQEGANQMAKEGSKYTDIIKHYYTGVEILKTSL